ncbi:MAG: murein biosynthesis integral membrane protein MurJ [Armatimonadota bacterium]
MTTQKTVTKAAGIMMVAILLSRVLGLVRDMLISGLFGQGRNTDIYYAAFKLPDLLFYLIAGGVISAAFVPVFVEYMAKDKKDEAWQLFSVIATIMAVVVAAFILLGEIFARQLVPLVAAPGIKDAAALDALAHLTRIVLPAQFFFFMGGLMMASLWAHNQFTAPGLGPSVYNIGIIIGGAIAGSRFGPQGVEGLAWGALAGAFAGNFVLQYVVLRRYGLKYKPNFNYRHPGAMRVWKLMIPVIFSLSLTYVDVYVNQLFASYLFKGAISALDRANRLMQVPIGIFGQSIAIGFYTVMAAQYATQKMDDFRATINYGLRTIAFVAIPSTIIMIVLRVPIIQLLFQHGHFNAEATREVADPLIFYAIGIFAWSAHPLMARAFYSMQNTLIPVVVGTGMTVIFVPLNYVLMKLMMHTPYGGHSGLALATTVAALGNMFLLIYLLRKKAGGINAKQILVSVGKITAASGIMGVAMWLTLHQVESMPLSHLPFKAAAGIRFLLPTAAGGAIFIASVRVLKLEEAATVWDMLKRKFLRRKA